MLKVAIVDDEYYALEGLRLLLQKLGGFELVGIYDSSVHFVEDYPSIKPDLVLIDIEMPVMNGFQVLERMNENGGRMPAIIFVTAYNQYAVKAFEINAVDYLVKPISLERLRLALARVQPNPQASANLHPESPNTSSNHSATPQSTIPQSTIPQSATPHSTIPHSAIPLSSIPQGEALQSAASQRSISLSTIPADLLDQMPGTSALTIRCFGGLSIMYDGREINTGWRSRKAGELLSYLISRKGQFTAKDKIADALWPDLDNQKAHANLYLTYYYVKQAEKNLNVDFHIESSRGKMRINLEEAVCDLVEMDRLIHEIESLSMENRGMMYDAERADAQVRCIALMVKFCDGYKGMLFEDGYYDWASSMIQHYEIINGNYLERLAVHYEESGDNEKVASYRQKLN